jgi:acylphosphatase
MSPPDRVAKRFLVRGAVQGVGYRAFARREAQRLGLAGHAENLDDGRVEVVVVGGAAAVAALEAALRRGPSYSRVEGVVESVIALDEANPSGFHIR